MSRFNDNVLSANGIVRSGQNNQLHCFLCTNDVDIVDAREHIENTRHAGAMRQFRLIFAIHDAKINCKACYSLIDWAGLKNHAEWHRIVPWHVIGDRYKIFFENHILQIEDGFYCLPCKNKFDDLSEVNVHISVDEHRNSMAYEPPMHKSFTADDSTYRSLVTEGFGPWDVSTVLCRLCKCPGVRLDDIAEHVQQSSHSKAKQAFSSNFPIRRNAVGSEKNEIPKKIPPAASQNVRKFRDGSNNRFRGNSPATFRPPMRNGANGRTKFQPRDTRSSRINGKPENSHNFPIVQRDDQRYCTICEIVVATSDDEHLAEALHKEFLRRYGHDQIEPIDDYKYRCKSCACTVPNLENVYRHIKGMKHRNSLIESPQHRRAASNKAPFLPLPQPPASQRLLPQPRPSHPSVPQPPVSQPTIPQSRLSQPPVPQPLLPQPTLAQPRISQSTVPQPPVPQPLLSQTKEGDSTIGKTISFKMNFPAPIGQNLTKSAWVSQPRDFIVMQNTKDLFCRICDCNIYGHANVDKHMSGEDHKKAFELFLATVSLVGDQMYHCRLCNCSIKGNNDIYIHIHEPEHAAAMRNREFRGIPGAVESPKNHDLPTNGRDAIAGKSENSTATNPRNDPCIVKLGSSDFCCKICHVLLRDQTKIPQHLDDKQHSDSVKLYRNGNFSEDGKYYCKSCGCTIPNFANVPLHAIGTKHTGKLAGTSSVTTKNRSEDAISLAGDYIAIIDDNDYYCRICNAMLSGRTCVDQHIKEKLHLETLEKYGCYVITMIDGNRYDCPWCDCIIPDLENIYVHLSGKRHLQNMSDQQRRGKIEKQVTRNVVVPKKPETRDRKKEDKTNVDETLNRSEARAPVISCSEKIVQKIGENQLPMDPNGGSTNPEDYENLIEMIVSKTKQVDAERIGKSSTPSIQENHSENPDVESDLSSKRKDVIDSPNDSTLCGSTSDAMSNATLNETSNFKRSNDSLAGTNDDFVKLGSLASSTLSLNESGISGRKRRAPRAMNHRENETFNDLDRIYDMRDKLRYIESCIKSCLTKDSNEIYCLICRKKIDDALENCHEHFSNLEHCEFYEGMKKDHALFEVVPGQLSELDLIAQYMEEISEDLIYCHVCDTDMDNIDNTLRDHIAEESHDKKRRIMSSKAEKTFHDIEPKMQCDWYDIFKFRCEPCTIDFDAENTFLKHLKSSEHASIMKKADNTDVETMYDFCTSCSLLWYGYRSTWAIHREVPNHRWRQVRRKDNDQPKLTTTAKYVLGIHKDYIKDSLEYMNKISTNETEKKEALIHDLERSTMSNFPSVKGYGFGSRVAGLDIERDGNIQVFLDCRNMYDGNESSVDVISRLKSTVAACLTEDSDLWDMEELKKSQEFSVRARHRPTGIVCDIFFDNGLAVEQTQLIKAINTKFPACRKMIIILTQWLHFCSLFGSKMITSNALCWCVIFYLQRQSIIPSIAKLIEMNEKSHLIAGWETGVSHNFTCDETSSFTFKELLVGFFKFYANFDYRYDVACPLIGETVKKRDFANPHRLPNQMRPYVNYLKNSQNPEVFRIDSPMCIQNPLCLVENLTKDVRKINLNQFRTYCSMSIAVLYLPSSQ